MIADERERTLALDPARSFIVQAPAGSGKTELLVPRYIRRAVRLAHAADAGAVALRRPARAGRGRARALPRSRAPHPEGFDPSGRAASCAPGQQRGRRDLSPRLAALETRPVAAP